MLVRKAISPGIPRTQPAGRAYWVNAGFQVVQVVWDDTGDGPDYKGHTNAWENIGGNLQPITA
jgi:hypothetical protein